MDYSDLAVHRGSLLKAMPEVYGYIGTFRSINKRWDGAITAGTIEAGRMEAEVGTLFGPLIQDMGSTKDKYSEIQERLVDSILFEMTKKTVFELTDSAKFAINILKRNLFERTADVGYLATDAEIVAFLRLASEQGDTEETWERGAFIRKRLAQYQYEYTVYDEIIIIDTSGRVLANLDENNPILSSSDSLLQATQDIDLHDSSVEDKYVETFRPTDLRPGHGNTLVYSQKIEDPESRRPLGTLCLCFNFEEEMEGIFQDLRQGNSQVVVAILDEKGAVLSSSDVTVLSLEEKVPVDLKANFRMLSFQGRPYLVSTVSTDGYQGFLGLTWYGLAMVETKTAFSKNGNQSRGGDGAQRKLQSFSQELSSIKNESDDLLADMKLDSMNGQVKAARFAANGFVEVLRFVDWIGDEIDKLFSAAIDNLQKTVLASLFNDIQFRAFQGNNIADRNLYERANDVCWWALTPLFRRLLAKHEKQGLDDDEQKALKDNLQYINDLYTPYLRLVLADTRGLVVAVSNPPQELEERFVKEAMPQGQEFLGMQLADGLVNQALALKSAQDYCVSRFEPSVLYGGRPTYIYSTAVRDPDNEAQAVGVIQIVFNAEPQFQAMLLDTLPRDESKEVLAGCFSLFADRDRTVISCTNSRFVPGEKAPLPAGVFNHKNGERASMVVELAGGSYAMGLQVSSGYREYKRKDNYINDIFCLVFVPV